MARLASFLPALGFFTVLGAALRGIHLGIPMRYDESATYLTYASHGWAQAISGYATPNNHVFHTMLVAWVTDWWGNSPYIIRLPAFLAGCALVPVSGWVATRLFDRKAGYVTAALVATSPILIEYSANARGHGLVVLLAVAAVGVAHALLERATLVNWLLLAVLGMVGLYTVPIMILPWLGVSLWLATTRFRSEAGLRERARSLVPVLLVNLLVVIYLAGFYSAVVRANGWEALLNNRFVEPQDWPVFIASIPSALAGIGEQWTRGIPLTLILVAVAGLVAVTLRPPPGDRAPLIYSLLGASVFLMLLRRNLGEARVWLWALPLVLMYTSAGLILLIRAVRSHLGKANTSRWKDDRWDAPSLAVSWSLVMSAVLLLAKPVWKSVETGTFPQGPEVATFVAESAQAGDDLVTDFITYEPLKYYLDRLGFYATTDTLQPQSRRTWIVLYRDGGLREDRVTGRTRGMLTPPLNESRPVFESGNTAVYLYGIVPEGSR